MQNYYYYEPQKHKTDFTNNCYRIKKNRITNNTIWDKTGVKECKKDSK